MTSTQTSSQRVKTAPRRTKDRRACKRYFIPPIYCDVAAPFEARNVTVVNLSAQGVCVVVPNPLPPGASLRLRLVSRRELCACEVTLRVSHSRGRPGGHCAVGGAFEQPLCHNVLRSLLG